MPNVAQRHESPPEHPDHDADRIAPRPRPGTLIPLVRGNSDILCKDVYRYWEDFLNTWVDPAIPKVTIQSTRVERYLEDEYPGKLLLVYCKDVRFFWEWVDTNKVIQRLLAQEKARIEAGRNLDRPAWRWLPEDTEQGPWILMCGENLVAKTDTRENRLGMMDTWGWCEPNEEKKEEVAEVERKAAWWENNVELMHSNHPYTIEPKVVRDQTIKPINSGSPNAAQKQSTSICTDVTPLMANDQAALIQIKAALLLVATLGCGISLSPVKQASCTARLS